MENDIIVVIKLVCIETQCNIMIVIEWHGIYDINLWWLWYDYMVFNEINNVVINELIIYLGIIPIHVYLDFETHDYLVDTMTCVHSLWIQIGWGEVFHAMGKTVSREP